MIAALIVVISLFALLQFFTSYCRSVVAASSKVALSDQVREVAGIEPSLLRGDEFRRLLQFVRLCPVSGDDHTEIRFVAAYYRLVRMIRALSKPLTSGLSSWAETELDLCAHFAAVTLDRRISYSRDLLAQQVGGPV